VFYGKPFLGRETTKLAVDYLTEARWRRSVTTASFGRSYSARVGLRTWLLRYLVSRRVYPSPRLGAALDCEAMDPIHDHRVGRTVDPMTATVADDQPAALQRIPQLEPPGATGGTPEGHETAAEESGGSGPRPAATGGAQPTAERHSCLYRFFFGP
jgi:hypothetical protein